jgi:hypothetical protein
MDPAPIKPKPPALDTAAASRQPLHQTIPACTMGYSIPNNFLMGFMPAKLQFYQDF